MDYLTFVSYNEISLHGGVPLSDVSENNNERNFHYLVVGTNIDRLSETARLVLA